MPDIHLHGVRENNLRDLSLRLPHGRWIAVTGPSGSGKSSLVFDTMVREGQRRYLGALSARARHYLGKLGRADADAVDGLLAPIAVGQRALTAHRRSTVGTLTGVLDLLRLLFARCAADPGGEALRRSHFSFNHPDGACPACTGLGQEDQVDPTLLVADPDKSLRDGALVPTLKNGYTVYSQVTLEVMDQICRAHGFDVHTPWGALTQAQQDVVLYGSTALKVPFGKHSLASRMRWSGITARPREEGHYRGLVPVIRETLTRNRNPNILRFVRSVPCTACDGTRLARPGRQARLGGTTLPALLALPCARLADALDALPASPVLDALRPSLQARLGRLVDLGLGHLQSDRASPTLSGGEAQRVRLAAQLSAGLGGQLVALDEPTLGLHPESRPGMQAVLQALLDLGNTLLVVEHDPTMVRCAHHLVALGPGAGPLGGRVLSAGPPEAAPGAPHPLGPPPVAKARARPARGTLTLTGARLHNLKDCTLEVPLGCFTVVRGPSGAGKSSLVFGTLLPALLGERGGPYTALTGRPASVRVQSVDASPIGRTPRSTPATWSGLFDLVRKRFAATAAAKARGFRATRFSYNTKSGQCGACAGLGRQKVGLHLLEDVELPCETCGGRRYAPDVLEVRLLGRTIADVLAMTWREAQAFFAEDPPLATTCTAMVELGLGYLQLGQSSTTLSRGEAQRVKLATLVARASREPALLLMDEPDRGLHPQDVARLLRAVDALVDAGHTVLAVSHHPHLWAAADRHVSLRDGRVQAEASRPALPAPGPPVEPGPPPVDIVLEGVSTHNLASVTVRIPHRRLTVVAGPSGSGKSSLAMDTLVAEAGARFAESLPFQVRRHMRRLPRPTLTAARGLTPTLALGPAPGRAGPRSTVATQTELGPLLRLLWSRVGRRDGAPGPRSASHFSPNGSLGACPSCAGLGEASKCTEAALVTHPERSLRAGAMAGTRPGRFFGEADGQTFATLATVLGEAALDTPWRDLTPGQRRLALEGTGEREVSVTWRYRRGERTGEHRFTGTWEGLLARVEAEAQLRGGRKRTGEQWRAPLRTVPCAACGGARLGPQARAVEVGGHTLPALLAQPLSTLRSTVATLALDDAETTLAAPILAEVAERVAALCDLSLGHLALHRRSDTLSGGELQRVRLASVLGSGLTGLTVVLDEPSAGLDDAAVAALLSRLRGLRDRGNTVVVVDHRPTLIRGADHLLELGPGAGPRGGQLVAQGPPSVVLAGDTPTAQALRVAPAAPVARSAGPGPRLRGATLHNLQQVDLDLPERGLVVVGGPSGSGKTSLVSGVLGASHAAGRPVGCVSVEGLARYTSAPRLDRTGSTVLDTLELLPAFQKRFDAVGSDLPRRAFSFRSPAGRCPTCAGSGREVVAMDFLADLNLPCPACAGRRFRPEVQAVRWGDWSPHGLLAAPAQQLADTLPEGPLRAASTVLQRLGLGHLGLGRDTRTLSGGERQRLGLARSLRDDTGPTLHLLDEPARGLHEADLHGLLTLLDELSARGDLIVATAHRARFIAHADLVVRLGPGGGPQGGRRM